jgi:hypothetical protein
MNLALWAALASGAAFVLTREEGARIKWPHALVASILLLVIDALYIFVWRLPLEASNLRDRVQAAHWQFGALRLVGVPLSKIPEWVRPPFGKDEKGKYIGWDPDFTYTKPTWGAWLWAIFGWSVFYQCATTMTLSLGVALALWSAALDNRPDLYAVILRSFNLFFLR